MIRKTNLMFYILLFFFMSICYSQRKVSIYDALTLLKLNSVGYRSIQRDYQKERLEYSIYKRSFLPKIDLNVSLPTYSRAINAITQPNGEILFLEQSQANSTFDLSLFQKIPLTGGTLILNSSFNRIDLFSSNRTQFSSSWFNILLNQPLNGYNPYKWGKKINKLKYEKNNIKIYKDFEKLNKELISLFFQTYIAQKKNELTRKNIKLTANYIENLRIKFEHGRILKTDLLKTELSLNQLKYKKEVDFLKYQNYLFDLKNMLGIKLKDSIILVEPSKFEKPVIDKSILEKRLLKFSLEYEFNLSIEESKQNLDKAKKSKGIQTELQIAYGLNSNATALNNLYQTPSSREYANFGIKIPLVNWNENKKRYNIARLTNDDLKDIYEKEKKRISVRVLNILSNIESVYRQIEYTKKSNYIVNLSKKAAFENLNLGRISIYDFNEELFEQEKIIIEHLNNIKSVWDTRFNLRRSTLYDFFLKDYLFIEE